MRGKVEESSTRETLSNSASEPVQSNPYEKTNANEEEEKVPRGKDLETTPPPYVTVTQPSPNLKSELTTTVQNSPLNNQPVQQTRIRERHPIDMLCPICGVTVRTRVETFSSIVTIGVVVILFFFVFCLAFIPLCIPRCKRTTHYCPNCNCELGKVREFE